MKRTASLGVLMVLCFVFMAVSMNSVVTAESNTIVVPDDYPSISAAVDHAADGDTVFVKKGTYYEHIEINKSISLVGESRVTTIIDGNKTGPVILINQNGVTITTLTVQNGMDLNRVGLFSSRSGIHLLHVSGCNISKNIIKNNSYGIWLYGSSNNTITENTVSTSNIGINIEASSDRNQITDNKIDDNTLHIHHTAYDDDITYGLLISNSRENTVADNVIVSNKEGIGLYCSLDNSIIGNTIQYNKDYGVTTVNSYSENNTFYNNIFRNTNQVSTPTDVINNWDNGTVGNYWSNYHGVDINGDGLGNIAYRIDENNIDHHPYMTAQQIPEFQPELILGFTLVASLTIVLFKKKVWKQTT